MSSLEPDTEAAEGRLEERIREEQRLAEEHNLRSSMEHMRTAKKKRQGFWTRLSEPTDEPIGFWKTILLSPVLLPLMIWEGLTHAPPRPETCK